MMKILFLFYTTLILISTAVFILFQPFTYIDNNKSYIDCADGSRYEASPNFIFALDKTLDPFNDKKARKLCQFKIISDYNDIYQTPKAVNYTFVPKNEEESSWPNALFASILLFLIGYYFLKSVTKLTFKNLVHNRILFLVANLVALLIYILFLHKPVMRLYCHNQVTTKLYYFHQSIKKNGASERLEDNDHISTFAQSLYEKCLH